MSVTNPPRRTTVNLALQGGGAHGAFTWGVLDALLEDGRLDFEGVSGTSAGAMNAICLAQGMMSGGRAGAREALSRFWTAIGESSPFAQGAGSNDGEPPTIPAALKLMLQWTEYLSPEQLNPFDLNPLRDILVAQIDFERLRTHSPVKLFIAATHANSGKLRIFDNAELSLEAVLASACLPTIHRTVTIAGEPYWDGGYSANPAVFPLFYDCTAADILLVLLTPLNYAETPDSAQDIRMRLRELGFSASFLREMRMFAHLRQRVGESRLPGWLQAWIPVGHLEQRVRQVRFHAISADALMGELPAESKLAANLSFFLRLRDDGRAHAQDWLAANSAAIGRQSTLDLAKIYY
jgi:NTE family protein